MIALIDADIIVFEAASVLGGPDPFDGDTRVDYCFEDLQERVYQEVDRIKLETEAEAVLMAFSPDSRLNFRKQVEASYKSNRKGKSSKPPYYWELVQWCRQTFPSHSIEGLEGDDVMGVMQTHPESNTIIVSTDKDMKTIPGKHYNHKKKELFEVTMNEANYFWMYQTLCGDSTDGYSGCPGIGDKKATKLLPDLDNDQEPAHFFKRLWVEVLETFKDHFEHPQTAESIAIRQARLARILRHGDYEFDGHSVMLWHPDPRQEIRYPISAIKLAQKFT